MSKVFLPLRASSSNGSAMALREVSPDDQADLAPGPARGLFVGEAGSLRIMDAQGEIVTLLSASSQYHPVQVRRVMETGTSARSIVALY